MSEQLDEIVRAQKSGEKRGLTSICSAHPWVLKIAMQGEGTCLIEATCNQVNQFGGYTGMKPADFAAYVHDLATEISLPVERLILGGDHLGPSVWQAEPASSAMQKAEHLVRAYVQAGFTKIHLDASMKLGDDDPASPLGIEISSRRTARLVKVAEETAAYLQVKHRLRYVIGSEVPIPGGATDTEPSISITTVESTRAMLDCMHRAFQKEQLEPAWERVIALVVQPGVEFGDDFVHEYDPRAAHELSQFIETTSFIYEVHSTDYQTPHGLQDLVRDHFAILKVGPALTYAFREAVFALAMVENELFHQAERSRLIERLEAAMLAEPRHWKSHYHGTEQQIALSRKYSLSDRIRYYWAQPDVQAALNTLLENFSDKSLPLSLISQYFPQYYLLIRQGSLVNNVQAILSESILAVLRHYLRACEPAL